MQGPKQVPGKNGQSARELERQQRGRNINRHSNWKEAAKTESVRAEDSEGTLTFNGVISYLLPVNSAVQKKQQQNSLLNLSFTNKLQGITFTGSTFESFPSVLMDSASGIQDKKHSFGQPLGGPWGPSWMQ